MSADQFGLLLPVTEQQLHSLTDSPGGSAAAAGSEPPDRQTVF